jgi:hypothetical protein
LLYTSIKLAAPEGGQDIQPKHVGALYDIYTNNVQLVGSEICMYPFLLLSSHLVL